MKTDRELLELAARAAGIDGLWVSNYLSGDYYYQGNNDGIEYKHDGGGLSVWNPLTDDGDALRLAVKLGILVDVTAFSVTAIVNGAISAKEKHNGDPYSSTRRAIVRAAAAIGEGIK